MAEINKIFTRFWNSNITTNAPVIKVNTSDNFDYTNYYWKEYKQEDDKNYYYLWQ